MRAARRYSLASKTRRSDHRKGYDRFTVEVGGCEAGAAWLVAREIFAAPGSTLHGGHEVDTHHEWVRGSREALQERDDLATGHRSSSGEYMVGLVPTGIFVSVVQLTVSA